MPAISSQTPSWSSMRRPAAAIAEARPSRPAASGGVWSTRVTASPGAARRSASASVSPTWPPPAMSTSALSAAAFRAHTPCHRLSAPDCRLTCPGTLVEISPDRSEGEYHGCQARSKSCSPSSTSSRSNTISSAAAARRSGWQRVFGGQVIGQALVAAARTVEGRDAHSLHAYFMRPGDPAVPIIYEVDRIRDGKSFATRRVVAIQHGEAIFSMSVSFQMPESRARPPDPDAGGAAAGGAAERGRAQASASSRTRPSRSAATGSATGRSSSARSIFAHYLSRKPLEPAAAGLGAGDRRSCPTTRTSTAACSPMPPT